MTAVVVVLAISLLVSVAILAAKEIDRAVTDRNARRAALQRALVVQAADQRMRKASRVAITSMLAAVDDRFTRGSGR